MTTFLFVRKHFSVILFCFWGMAAVQAMEFERQIAGKEEALNIVRFGTLCYWNSESDLIGTEITYDEFPADPKKDNIGVRWWDARDIRRIEVLWNSSLPDDLVASMRIEYWHDTWPDHPPHMPSYDDLEDDLWRGEWVTAKTKTERNGNKIIYTFQPLLNGEIANAENLPGEVEYRRTMKIRLKFPEDLRNQFQRIDVFSMATLKEDELRIEFLDEKANNLSGRIEVFNGFFKSLSGWNWKNGDKKSGNSWNMHSPANKGIIIKTLTSQPLLAGSNEETLITVRSSGGTFSFAPDDLQKGPMYIPYFNVYITKADDPVSFLEVGIVDGKNIREQIMEEPEQSYEKARNEIPHLDPLHDQAGSRIYLPLACDGSWQKFAVEWGGNLILDKERAKLQGKLLSLCNWNGNSLEWDFGTGEAALYERTLDNCRMSVLHDYLPVVSSDWNHDGLLYKEEAFVTSSGNGVLSPFDPGRDEYTPSVLMVQLKVSNPSRTSKVAHLWLRGNHALTNISREKGFILDQVGNEKYIRCYAKETNDDAIKTELIQTDDFRGIHHEIELAPNSSKSLYFCFPFVGTLTSADMPVLSSLNYSEEKARVVTYWRDLVAKNTVFNVPEAVFNQLAKAVIPHIRMSVTKDPQSGLFMVPAASFSYPVYANESIFQTVLLDRLGDFETVDGYLDVFMKRQGSRKLPGAYTGDQKAVFYGVKIDEENDLTAVGYNMNHGTVLWGLAHHYRYSGDKEWLKKAAPHMTGAADWIIEQRNQTKETDRNGDPVLHYGLLPAGMLEDCPEWRYWYATNAYAYLGLQATAEAFDVAGLPEAEYYKMEAAAYRDDILNSLQRAIELSPVVRLRDNTCVPYIPVRPYQRFRYFGSKKSDYYDRYEKGIYPTLRLSSTREVLYGPVTLIKTGIIDPKSPMADWILNDWEDNLTLSTSLNLNTHGWVDDEYWFSRGGMVFQANLQNPVSVYLDRQETKAAIRSLYNNFTSLFYPDVVALSEEYRMWEHASGPFYKCPDEARVVSQIIDFLLEEKANEVWLGNGIPERWLEPGQRVELNQVHTKFGEYSYSLAQGKEPNTMVANILLPENSPKTLLFLHDPFQKSIQSVIVNGQEWANWDADQKVITLPQNRQSVHLLVKYE
ncbi:hypothetical protein [Gaoshiqia sp. Z1-71]|uniref:hypothetical protein n=1 Tax=Gaoshiqia hydrogeniformans TaxID=3290090 RepID=UPI003BF8722F